MTRIPIRNVYYLLCYAWGHMDESDVVDASSLDRFERVHDLFGTVLAEGTFRLLKRGIDRGYREVTRDLRGLRGKLEMGAMATRALRARGLTSCTYEELSHDVLHNRILRSTLHSLLSVRDLDGEVRSEVGLAYRKLDGIQVLRLRRAHFRRVQLDRNLRVYRFLLSICELLHDSLLVDDGSGTTRFRDFRENDARMWKVFEDFVTEFYRREQDIYRVRGQTRVPWHEARAPVEEDLARVPEMWADVILESEERRIILDTKFYRHAFGGRMGTRKLHSSNLYQLLTYLENRQGALPNGPRHEGMLLYPAVEETFVVDVVLNGFRVQARSVDLTRGWREIEGDLLGAIMGLGECAPGFDPPGVQRSG